MHGWEIRELLQSIPVVYSHFEGICSKDEAEKFKFKKHDSFIIANTETSDKVGSHWLVIYQSRGHVEVFNSMGTSAEEISNFFVFADYSSLEFNSFQVQPTGSSSCGHFCIYFVTHRIVHLASSFKDICNAIFKSDCHKNEEYVSEFMHWLNDGD
jgi:hypothetical protein